MFDDEPAMSGAEEERAYKDLRRPAATVRTEEDQAWLGHSNPATAENCEPSRDGRDGHSQAGENEAGHIGVHAAPVRKWLALVCRTSGRAPSFKPVA